MANSTYARTRSFLLRDLTPATRRLFRAYRDAERVSGQAAKVMWDAYAYVEVPKRALQLADEGAWEPTGQERARLEADLAARQAKHAAASAVWEAAAKDAEAAFKAARPAMEAEGYPYAWWMQGVMRIPRGVTPDNPRLRP